MSMFGKRVRARREELGWSQEELAFKMGYKTKSSINKIELGHNNVYQSTIVKFSEVLGVSISYLMGWEDEEIEQTSKAQEESLEDLTGFDNIAESEEKKNFLN